MNFTPQQQHSLLSKMGYNGPVDSNQMENFIASNPGAAAKMGKFQRALTKGFQTGGLASFVTPLAATSTPSSPNWVEEAKRKVEEAKKATPTPTSSSTLQNWPELPVPPDFTPPDFTPLPKPTPPTPEPNPTPVSPTQQGSLVSGTGITSPIAAQKDKYSEAVDKLAKAEQAAAGWSVEVKSVKTPQGKTVYQPLLSNSVADRQPITAGQADTEAEAKKLGEEKLVELQTKEVEEPQQEFTKAQQDLGVAQAQQAATAPSAKEVTSGILQDPTSMVTQVDPAQMVATPDQIVQQGTGQVTGPTPQGQVSTAGPAATAVTPTATPAATVEAAKVTPQVTEELTGLKAAQGEVSSEAQVTAAQQTESSVSQLQAAQGEAILMDNPVQREIQEGELISGSAVDAQKVEKMNSQLQAAEATPSDKATVQGQLEGLMQDFEGGATPPWAAGAMRNAQAMLAQRGLGASSMAGQAVIQAAMESALPIAQADANTRAQFESQNLSNRQQVAMFAAEQRARFLELDFNQEFQSRVQNASRIADIANMNFTAEQQIALENSRIANTVNLQNLNNRQAMVMAEASALANLDLSNLNNRQQAAVQNAQSFLQMDMANLNNEQQTSIFKTQQRVNALLSDQAAENAAEQFNAASENQTNQFFADLASTTSRFNADQKNAIEQFNAGQENAMEQFNASIEEQRDQFNANNRLVIAQANAKWRQDIATLNTAAENEALATAAKTANALTANAVDNIWQRERDLMNFAFTQSENKLDRDLSILLGDKELSAVNAKISAENDRMAGAGIAAIGSTLIEGIFF